MFRALMLLAAVALTFAVLIATTQAQPPAKAPRDTCVVQNKACAEECLKCMKHCEKIGHMDVAKMCEACHHACLLCATAVGNKTPLAWDACELCEKFCTECAAMCDKHNLPETKKCAEECRKCAKACAEARK